MLVIYTEVFLNLTGVCAERWCLYRSRFHTTPPPSCTNSLGDSRWSSTSPDTSPRCRYTCWTWFPPNISNPLKWKKEEKTNIRTALTDPISTLKEEIEAQQPAKVTWCKLNIPLTCVTSGSADWERCTFTVTFPVSLTQRGIAFRPSTEVKLMLT